MSNRKGAVHGPSDNAQLAWDTVLRDPRNEIPIWLVNPMEWTMIDRLAVRALSPVRSSNLKS